MKKKDIMFLCQYSYPEFNSSATLPFDTARSLVQNGRAVDLLCGWPKEYSQTDHISARETVDGVNIQRLRYLQLSRAGKLGRIINFVSFTLAVMLHLGTLRKYRCVIVYSNPPILPLVCVLANLLFKTRFVFVVYDVYPEIASASGEISCSGMVFRVMNRINRQVSRRAAGVVALTDEMRDFLLAHRPQLDSSRIVVIPNWAHEESDKAPAERVSNGVLVVSYFGNLGICQDTDTILEALELLRNDKNVRFLFAAHGLKKTQIQQCTADYENVEFLDYLTGEQFLRAAGQCSCGIVSLEPGLTGMCAPSKYYSYLHSGQAVIAVVDENSFLAQEIRAEQIGNVVAPGDGAQLAQLIREMAGRPNETAQMGFRARALYESRYRRDRAMGAYERLISEVSDDGLDKGTRK